MEPEIGQTRNSLILENLIANNFNLSLNLVSHIFYIVFC